MYKLALSILIIPIFISCISDNKNLNSDAHLLAGESTVRYAKGFDIIDYGKFKYVVVKDPWKKAENLFSYIISDHLQSDEEIPDTADFFVNLPVEDVAVMSSSGIGMLCILDERDLIGSATNPELIYDSVLYQRHKRGNIIDLGETNQFNIEYIIDNSPDLVFKYIYGSVEAKDIIIKNAGIPVAYNLEYMETHPLGRAEWLKYTAAFFNKLDLADSIFRQIEENYKQISEPAKNKKVKPSVLDGSIYNGVWYAAGGKSYQAILYEDAGADYYWKDNNETGSNAISFEYVIENQLEADYWIGASTGNMAELLNIESRYKFLKSFRNNNVFHYGERINPSGGLDYFESGVVRPDIVLKDLISIFHPDLVDPGYKPIYICRIK
ncbi:MAG: ABC transporter substrate-binding protein [Bacteroidales bacterium]|nr:ABC transporter substrate-binding protein [Bacteroidales bacterium]